MLKKDQFILLVDDVVLNLSFLYQNIRTAESRLTSEKLELIDLPKIVNDTAISYRLDAIVLIFFPFSFPGHVTPMMVFLSPNSESIFESVDEFRKISFLFPFVAPKR